MESTRTCNFIVAGVMLLLWTALPAHAGVRFSLFGDLDSSTYSTGGVQTSGEAGLGGGLGLEIPLNSFSGLEIDGVYLNRKNQIQASYVQIPVLYRLWLGSIVTLGAGAYYSQGIGSVTANGTTESFSDAGYTQNDAGLMGVAGFNIPISFFYLMIEGRYDFGIYDVSAIQGVTATFNDFQVLVGIRMGSF